MKPLLIFLVLFSGILIIPGKLFAQNGQPDFLTIQGDNVKIRSAASTQSQILTMLNKTNRCNLLGKSVSDSIGGKKDYWYKISNDSVTGFVFGAFTSMKLDGRIKTSAVYDTSYIADLFHLIFVEKNGKYLDFGEGENYLNGFNLYNNETFEPNAVYRGKVFEVTWNNLFCATFENGNVDNTIIAERPTIVSLILTK